ncbi:Clavaminate synthase-like protein [Viridothelium virens]|uniref:Clavaminate synthase-like protein n=1 Tax=Viridothelium virens TaxID=1048519 RepID=A0A6A6H0L0_VIRVR|nr:Clavaminate synthase-like protein [Viridothelium virens]
MSRMTKPLLSATRAASKNGRLVRRSDQAFGIQERGRTPPNSSGSSFRTKAGYRGGLSVINDDLARNSCVGRRVTGSCRYSTAAQSGETEALDREYIKGFQGRQNKSIPPSPIESKEASIEARLELVDPLLLRDQCQCELCVDPSSHQKLFQTSDIPSALRPSKIVARGEKVELLWDNDVFGYSADHKTQISLDKIEDLFRASQSPKQLVTWDRSVFRERRRSWKWSETRGSGEMLYEMLRELDDYGLVFLEAMPQLEAEQSISSTYGVEQIGNVIGPLRDSLYGRTWDVRSVANAKNIAYTHQYLGLHMDLLYMTNPPDFQILHCLQAPIKGGGESVFVDSFRAAETMLQASSNPITHPLCTYPMHYHYHHVDARTELQNNHYYRNSHPVIELDEHQHVINVNWSPPFQAPLQPYSLANDTVSTRRMREWHQAAQEFSQIIERPDMQFEYLLKPGEAVIFNNRRALHARKAFDVSKGPRWLKGAYIDGDSVWSKLRVLREWSNGK